MCPGVGDGKEHQRQTLSAEVPLIPVLCSVALTKLLCHSHKLQFFTSTLLPAYVPIICRLDMKEDYFVIFPVNVSRWKTLAFINLILKSYFSRYLK